MQTVWWPVLFEQRIASQDAASQNPAIASSNFDDGVDGQEKFPTTFLQAVESFKPRRLTVAEGSFFGQTQCLCG